MQESQFEELCGLQQTAIPFKGTWLFSEAERLLASKLYIYIYMFNSEAFVSAS